LGFCVHLHCHAPRHVGVLDIHLRVAARYTSRRLAVLCDKMHVTLHSTVGPLGAEPTDIHEHLGNLFCIAQYYVLAEGEVGHDSQDPAAAPRYRRGRFCLQVACFFIIA